MKRMIEIVCFLLGSNAVQAQTEFYVNTRRDTTQRDVRLGVDQSGVVTAVWKSIKQSGTTSRGDIVMRKFDTTGVPLGAEEIVSVQTVSDQERPAMAVHPDGAKVIAWASLHDGDTLYDVHARWFPSGSSPSIEIRVNTTTTKTQNWPAVAMDAAGNSVIAWESWDQDGGDRGIYAQRYNAAGAPTGSEFRLNQTIAYSQARPDIEYLPTGNFVASWESWSQDGGSPIGYGVYARIFNADGTPATDEFQVNTYVNDYQWQADIAVLSDSSFVITWCSWREDGAEGGIYLRRYSMNGVALSGEISVNRSTAQYQWLPRAASLPGGGFAVIWSSWKQDGSREGVYVQFFDRDGRKTSFESPVNVTTASFQWEPAVVGISSNAIWAAWSNWTGIGDDYDVMGRVVRRLGPETSLIPSAYTHSGGRSTASIIVHVVDSTVLTGNEYELVVDSATTSKAYLQLRNVTTSAVPISSYVIDRGQGVLYLLPTVDGFAVEVIPELQFDLDYSDSRFAYHSATNIQFVLQRPSAGIPLLAPIDIVLIWGSTDTLATGEYTAPLDSAINVAGQQVVKVPFRAWNLTDNAPVGLWVPELASGNKKWDAGERIVIRTPIPYRTAANNSHAQLQPVPPAGSILFPQPGDTNYISTYRPLSAQDRFRFRTEKSFLAGIKRVNDAVPERFALEQNYPNPFNPETVVRYELRVASRVSMKVYDLLGREVALLVDERQSAGTYEVTFNGSRLASGIYFGRMEAGMYRATVKMVLLK